MSTKPTQFIGWCVLAVVIGVAALIIYTYRDKESDGNSLPKVTVGIQVSPAMTLVMVAKDKGFFDDEGVDVELKEFTAGKFALQAFLSGSIDFAISGEVPACLAALQGNDLRVVSQVVEKTINEVRIVALKDGEPMSANEYFKKKKRKLSTSFGGGPEMFTYSFLKYHKIDMDQVELISQKPEDMPATLESGGVDAIAIFDPFAFIAEQRLGEKVVTYAEPDIYSELYVLNARPDQLAENPEIILAILRALYRAGDFIEKEPEESKQICQKYTKLGRDIIDGIWGNFVFRPAITPQLLKYWEAEAEWAKETGKVRPETPVPDFRQLIDDRFLKKVAPDTVRIK